MQLLNQNHINKVAYNKALAVGRSACASLRTAEAQRLYAQISNGVTIENKCKFIEVQKVSVCIMANIG